MLDGWLNIYKPKGVSSAKIVAIVKRKFGKKSKIGHAGTLDLEAEGILPIAIGRATKLIRFMMDARKSYRFEVQFGAKTDTADASGKVVETIDHIPDEKDADSICKKFIGQITQKPPIYSALKVNGKRAYDLARAGQEVELKPREITIYELLLESYNQDQKTATYITECSKGTYIRTLAEDISLSLQSLGFVLLLARTKVGTFEEANSTEISGLEKMDVEKISHIMHKMEVVLENIPVLGVDTDIAKKIIFGQKVEFDNIDLEQVWIRYKGEVLAIGNIKSGYFDSERVIMVGLN